MNLEEEAELSSIQSEKHQVFPSLNSEDEFLAIHIEKHLVLLGVNLEGEAEEFSGLRLGMRKKNS